FEGIIAKRRDSLYEPGKRSGAWLKYRVHKGQEFVIGGYVPPKPLHSIIFGYFPKGEIIYAPQERKSLVCPTPPPRRTQHQGLTDRHLPLRKPTRTQTHAMGANAGGNEKLGVGEA